MRKLFCLAGILAVSLLACKKEDLNNNGSFLSIRPDVGVKLKSALKSEDHLTAIQIVKQAYGLSFRNENISIFPDGMISRGFGDELRDTVEMRLKLYATDVIKEDGSLKRDLIEGRDFVITRSLYDEVKKTFSYDTIAYIPNGTVREAEFQIKIAYQQGDIDRCRYVMDQYFRFIPITGAEWKKLPKSNF